MNPSRVVTILAALSLTLIRLPVYVGHQAVLAPVVLVVLAACIAWGLPRARYGSLLSPMAAAAFIFALIAGISRLRGAQIGAYGSLNSAAADSFTYIVFVAFGIVLMTSAASEAVRVERMVAIVAAPVIYVLTNLVMHLGGLQSKGIEGLAEGTPATLLATFGYAAGRVKFPLATSINLFSVVIAAGLAGMIVLHFRSPRLVPRWVMASAGFACVFALLLEDSRTSIVLIIVVSAVLVLRVRIPGWLVGGVIPFLPLIVINALKLVGTGLNAALSRGNEGGDFVTASNRLYIWDGAWQTLKHPDLHLIYGWGAGGQDTSGAFGHYAYLFPPGNPVQTHSIVLQTILDSGLIGLAAIAVAAGVACWQLQRYLDRKGAAAAAALLAVLLVPLINGATESSPTYWSDEALIVVLFVMGAAAGLAMIPASGEGRPERVPVAASERSRERAREPAVIA